MTTHQVAQALGVTLPTVVNWVKAGRLRAHRTPGGHRRIAPEDLASFAREHDYPLPASAQPPAASQGVLVVHAEPDYCEMLAEYLDLAGALRVHTADGAFGAGYALGSVLPRVVVLDPQVPGLDAAGFLRHVAQTPALQGTRVIVSADARSPEEAARWSRAGAWSVVDRAVPLESLLAAIQSALATPAEAASPNAGG